MENSLSQHFTYCKLIKFTLPMIVVMVLASVYGIVDGIFVSNIVGEKAFVALNLIMPYIMLFGTVGFMVGTGGSALVAKTLGEGEKERANGYFSMLVFFLVAIGAAFSLVGIAFLRPVARLLGAEGETFDLCAEYGLYTLIFMTAFMLMNAFQSFLTVAGKAHLALVFSTIAGVLNMLLDFLFMYVFRMGIVGAALGTGLSYVVGGGLPFLYFLFPNRSSLRLKWVKWEKRPIFKSVYNGISELFTNVALSVANMLYNFQLMRLVGEAGVSAYGIIMYVSFIFVGIFCGFAVGVGPIVGYHYGAGNREELSGVLKKSALLIFLSGIVMTIFAELLARPFAGIFVGYDAELLALSERAFRLYSFSYLFVGLNIFCSAFFTGLNNGLVSGLISFLRTFVMQIAMIFFLPLFLGVDGVWLAVVVAEVLTLFVSTFLVLHYRKKYGYSVRVRRKEEEKILG